MGTKQLASAKPEIQIGKQVRISRDAYKDQIGTVAEIDGTTLPYRVIFADGRWDWFFVDEVEFLKPIAVKDLYELKQGEEMELDIGRFTITVRRRSADWWACLNGNKGVWCCGSSLDFVIGYTAVTYFGWLHTLNNPKSTDLHEQARRILAKP